MFACENRSRVLLNSRKINRCLKIEEVKTFLGFRTPANSFVNIYVWEILWRFATLSQAHISVVIRMVTSLFLIFIFYIHRCLSWFATLRTDKLGEIFRTSATIQYGMSDGPVEVYDKWDSLRFCVSHRHDKGAVRIQCWWSRGFRVVPRHCTTDAYKSFVNRSNKKHCFLL